MKVLPGENLFSRPYQINIYNIVEKFRVIITAQGPRDGIILYAKSAGRHADFISRLYHLHLDESRKEANKRRRGRRAGKRGEKGREAVKEENGGNSLVEDSSPPPANAKWYWNEKAGRKGGHGAGKERSGRFRLRFPGERAGWSSSRSSREREKSGKKRGGDASITLEKRKRRCTEKEPAV